MPEIVPIYIFDTSALIDMDKFYPVDRDMSYWRHVDRSINQGRFKAPYVVLDEVSRRDDELVKWLKPRRKIMQIPISPLQNNYVREIQAKFKGLCNHRSGNLNGDPFVIACAIEIINGIQVTFLPQRPIVVAQEGQKKKITIPKVCGHYGVECITIDQLWEKENWTSE